MTLSSLYSPVFGKVITIQLPLSKWIKCIHELMSKNLENKEILNKQFYIVNIYYFQWKPKPQGMKEVNNLRPEWATWLFCQLRKKQTHFNVNISACGLYLSKLLLDYELSLRYLKLKISRKNSWWSYPKPVHPSLFSFL